MAEWTPLSREAEENAIARLVEESGLSRDFVVWYLAQTGTALDFVATVGSYAEAGKQLQGIRQIPIMDKGYNEWLATRAGAAAEGGEAAEAGAFGIRTEELPPIEGLPRFLSHFVENASKVVDVDPSTLTETTTQVAEETSSIFRDLTQEELDQLGVEGISEKFGLQRLAIEEPEAFLRAMFDKAGVTPSPPVYGFVRDLMPSLTLLASTREGQDIMTGGGALELNKVLNEVLEQGYPTRESVLGGLAGLEGLARPFLTAGIEDPRTRFSFVMSTLDKLVGPTMSEPLRRSLFSRQMAEDQGDKFLSASARGVFEGDFIDWLRGQGYPLPELPAYEPEPGAVPQVATEGGLAQGVTSSGAPAFLVKEGIYE